LLYEENFDDFIAINAFYLWQNYEIEQPLISFRGFCEYSHATIH